MSDTDAPNLTEVRRLVHEQMGGADRVAALRAADRRSARDFVADFFDPGSFVEIGTFAGMRAGDPATAGDGRLTGCATVDGHEVGVIVDDVTVKRASSTGLTARKAERVVKLAERTGHPVLFVGEAGGARLPDTLRGEVFASEAIYPWLFRDDRPPLISAIVGESYGGSSFVASMADISVMLAGSVLALTSPRVIQMATGATVTSEELGGADVVAAKTDLVDIVVRGTEELDAVLRQALGFFTQRQSPAGERAEDEDISELVLADPSKVYDVRTVIDRLVDIGSFLELGATRGRSLIVGLARIDGRAVGLVASQPCAQAGALSPAACAKAERLTRLCSRFGFPIVSLVDTPGFQIGVSVEHSGMLRAAMNLIKANTAARCPVVTVVLRKAYGLAFFALFSPDHGGDVVLAWPDARIGFMAPATAANVLYGAEVAHLGPAERRDRLAQRAASIASSASVIDVAAAMGIDEVIEKAHTIASVRRYLDILAPRTAPSPGRCA